MATSDAKTDVIAGLRVLLIGDPATGKTTSFFPSEAMGIQGLDPEHLLVIQCAGTAKQLPIKGWRKIFNTSEPVKGGKGRLLFTQSYKLIKAVLYEVAANRPDITDVLIDDVGFTSNRQALMADGKLSYDDYTEIAQQMYQNIFDPITNDTKLNRLNIYVSFHKGFDKMGIPEVLLVGNMLQKYTGKIEGMFSTVLASDQIIDPTTGEDKYVFYTSKVGNVHIARSLPGCFPTKTIPNDMGLVVKYLNEYNS